MAPTLMAFRKNFSEMADRHARDHHQNMEGGANAEWMEDRISVSSTQKQIYSSAKTIQESSYLI